MQSRPKKHVGYIENTNTTKQMQTKNESTSSNNTYINKTLFKIFVLYIQFKTREALKEGRMSVVCERQVPPASKCRVSIYEIYVYDWIWFAYEQMWFKC